MAAVESKIAEVVQPQFEPVDREKEYFRGQVPSNELQIYTWMDCTLRELMGLIKEVNYEARRPGTYFDFAVVRPDDRGSYEMRTLGSTTSGQKGIDDLKTLSELKFVIGDYIDVAVYLPDTGRGAMRGGASGCKVASVLSMQYALCSMGRGPPMGARGRFDPYDRPPRDRDRFGGRDAPMGFGGGGGGDRPRNPNMEMMGNRRF